MGVRSAGAAFGGSLATGGTVAGNLVVTGTLNVQGATDLDSTLNVDGVTTIPAGSLTAASLRFAGSAAGTGLSAQTADAPLLGRGGATYLALASSGVSTNATLNPLAALLATGALRLDAEAIKTADYTLTNSDVIVIMNGVALTATLVASPAGDQCIFIKNRAAGNLTVARNGNTIDGAAADLTLAAGEGVLLYFEPSGWVVLLRG